MLKCELSPWGLLLVVCVLVKSSLLPAAFNNLKEQRGNQWVQGPAWVAPAVRCMSPLGLIQTAADIQECIYSNLVQESPFLTTFSASANWICHLRKEINLVNYYIYQCVFMWVVWHDTTKIDVSVYCFKNTLNRHKNNKMFPLPSLLYTHIFSFFHIHTNVHDTNSSMSG